MKYIFSLTFILSLSLTCQSFAAKKAHSVATPAPFDHEYTDLTSQLKNIVFVHEGDSLVNYKKLQRDSKLLNKFLKESGKVTQKSFDEFDQPQKLAFLINNYNALTLKLIVDNYPFQSIKKLGGIFKSPWKLRFFRLLGREHSLDEIEHEMLEKNFIEPRLHFALFSASISSPMLRPEAYTPTKIDEQLNNQAKIFMTKNDQNSIDVAAKKLKLSKIFDWYKDDFLKSEKPPEPTSLQQFVANYITDDPVTKQLLDTDAFDVSFSEYNWDINSTKE